jgi:FKBP-type peptidyl-prolyl cis-trans isomerase FkpA
MEKRPAIILGVCVVLAAGIIGISKLDSHAKPPVHVVQIKPAAFKEAINITPPNATKAQLEALINPKNFKQYNKYKYARQAYYIDTKLGDTATVKPGHSVSVGYIGWLTNGKQFDATKENSKGQPEAFQFTLDAHPSQVVTGWNEGIQGMKLGGVRLIIVPPSVGYGSKANGAIPADSVLVFEVEILELE